MSRRTKKMVQCWLLLSIIIALLSITESTALGSSSSSSSGTTVLSDEEERRALKAGARARENLLGATSMARVMNRQLDCTEGTSSTTTTTTTNINEFTCVVKGPTMGRLPMPGADNKKDAFVKAGPWSLMGEGNPMFAPHDENEMSGSTGMGSVHFGRAKNHAARLELYGKILADKMDTLSFDFMSHDGDGMSDSTTMMTEEEDEDGSSSTPMMDPPFRLRVLVSNRREGSSLTDRGRLCLYEFTPTMKETTTTSETNSQWTTYMVEGIANKENESATSPAGCTDTISALMSSGTGVLSDMRQPKLVSLELFHAEAKDDAMTTMTDGSSTESTMAAEDETTTMMMSGFLDNVMVAFDDMTYTFDFEPAPIMVGKMYFDLPMSRLMSYRTGWYVNSPSRKRSIRMSGEQASMGRGSLKLGPIAGDDTVLASYNMKRVLRGGATESNLELVEFDYFIMSGGGSAMYLKLSLYANMPVTTVDSMGMENTNAESVNMEEMQRKRRKKRLKNAFPDPESFDCRFDYVPPVMMDTTDTETTMMDTNQWSAMSVRAMTNATMVTSGEGIDCPVAYADLPGNSTFGLLRIEVRGPGDLSTTPDGTMTAYLDSVSLDFGMHGFQTFDFDMLEKND